MRRVLIVDDYEIIRDGVKRILDEPPGTTLFGEASSVPAALQLVQEQAWDATILDLSVGGRSGLELLREMKEIRPRLPVIILSMHAEEQYVRRAFKAGASCYVTKSSSRRELVKAVSKATEGSRYVSAELTEKLLTNLQENREGPAHEVLSNRELEVLRLLGSGRTVGEIAGLLSLSDKTISTYRSRILDKLNLKTSAELIRYAIHHKLSEY